jgi:F-type H+-transporting ATPase subunit epsilon
MQLDIITPEKILYSAEAQMVVVPGTLGDFGVLPGHAPFVSTIRPGIITIDTQDGQQRRMAVIGGLAEVVPERCTVLAEYAVDCAGLTQADVAARIEKAKEDIAVADTDTQKALAEKRLLLAETLQMAV